MQCLTSLFAVPWSWILAHEISTSGLRHLHVATQGILLRILPELEYLAPRSGAPGGGGRNTIKDERAWMPWYYDVGERSLIAPSLLPVPESWRMCMVPFSTQVSSNQRGT